MRIPSCLRSLTITAWVGVAGALTIAGLAHAELVETPTPMSPGSGDEPQKWLLRDDNMSVDIHALKSDPAPAAKGKFTTEPITPSVTPSPASADRPKDPKALPSPDPAQTSQPPAKAPTARADPTWEQELRSNVKNIVRPLHDEAVDLGVMDAVHSLQAELGMDVGQSFKEKHHDGTLPSTDKAVNPGAAQWETQGAADGPKVPARTAAQIEREQLLASDLLNQMIDDIQPWALSLLALYALFYMVKGVRAFMRAKAAHRVRSRTRHSLRRHQR